MQRLIEQPTGEGDVLEGATRLGRVHYHLSVYQHFSTADGEQVQPSLDVEGRLTPVDAVDPAAWFHRRADLVLRLGDGRSLEFSVVAADGTIRSTGRSLF